MAFTGVHAYSIGDAVATLCVGVPPGRVRPALYFNAPGLPPCILAQFQGEREAEAAVLYLDAMMDVVNKAVEHYEHLTQLQEKNRGKEADGG